MVSASMQTRMQTARRQSNRPQQESASHEDVSSARGSSTKEDTPITCRGCRFGSPPTTKIRSTQSTRDSFLEAPLFGSTKLALSSRHPFALKMTIAGISADRTGRHHRLMLIDHRQQANFSPRIGASGREGAPSSPDLPARSSGSLHLHSGRLSSTTVVQDVQGHRASVVAACGKPTWQFRRKPEGGFLIGIPNRVRSLDLIGIRCSPDCYRPSVLVFCRL